MTENKRFRLIDYDEDYFTVDDDEKGEEYDNPFKVIDVLNELDDKNKFLSDFRGFIDEEHQKLKEENEELKQVLGSILLEVKKDITNTSCTGEIKVFINPNSFNLISDVLRKYGALKEWYE